MKQWMLGFGLCLALGHASAQEVWKCEEDGVVRYTDQPCEGQGHPVLAATAASAASAASAPQAIASGAMVTSVRPAADRNARRTTADAARRSRDPLAPMPAGFVQRGNPRAAQTVAAVSPP